MMPATSETILLLLAALLPGGHPQAAPGVTSLTNAAVKFTTPDVRAVELRRGDVSVVIVDNLASGAVAPGGAPSDGAARALIPDHQPGYNGVARWVSAKSSESPFVPAFAGLNFEHIHDGTKAVDRDRFEPRTAPMRLRVVDAHTVELHQPPTPNWKLESCGRFHLLPDGSLEYTFECVPRAATFHEGRIGLFWASYIHRPDDKAIHFRGRIGDPDGDPVGGGKSAPEWIRSLSPKHGVDATHPPDGAPQPFPIVPDFSLTLVNHPSRYRHVDDWYYGVRAVDGKNPRAVAQIFRPRDKVWFAQSPTGGGDNPAWDFQWFVTGAKVGEAYGFTMRAVLAPFESRAALEALVRPHREALANPSP